MHALFLLLSCVLGADYISAFLKEFKESKAFLKHNDLYSPLGKALWATLPGGEKMLMAVQARSISDSDLSSHMERIDVSSFFLVERRGLLRYEKDLVSKVELQELKEDGEELSSILTNLGSPAGLGSPYEQIVLLAGFAQSDANRLPAAFWSSLSREQLGQVIQKGGLAPVLNRMTALGLADKAEAKIWRKEGKGVKAGSLLVNEECLYILDQPGVVVLEDVSEAALERFAQQILDSLEALGFLSQTNSQLGMRLAAKLYGHYNSSDGGKAPLDKEQLERSWHAILANAPPLQKIMTPQLNSMRNVLAKRLANPDGAGRAEEFVLQACEVAFGDGPAGKAVHDLALKYIERLRTAGSDRGALRFMGKIKKQVIDIGGIAWDLSKWGPEEYALLSKLPPRFPEYTELLVSGFLLGGLIELPHRCPTGSKTADWKSLGSAKTVEAKLGKKWIKENVGRVAVSLLWAIEANPIGVKLPAELIDAVIECKTAMEPSLRTAIIAHAARQDEHHGSLLKSLGPAGLKAIKSDSLFAKLPLPRLKLFLGAAPVDAISLLLPDRERLLSKSNGELSSEMLDEICQHVLSARYDPDDLQILVALLEANKEKVEVETLLQMQYRLLQIDATTLGHVPDPDAMHRIAMLLIMKGHEQEQGELTLEDLAVVIPSHFPSASFALVEAEPIEHLEFLDVHQALDSLLWQTPGHELACASLLHVVSYVGAERDWSEELTRAARWVVDGLSGSNTLNLLNRIYRGSRALIQILLEHLETLGFDNLPSTSSSLAFLEPSQSALALQEDQAGLQSLLVSHERSFAAKSGCFPMDLQPVLNRYFELMSLGEVQTCKKTWEQARSLTGSLETAFQLMTLASSFKNLPMKVIWELLVADAGSIARTAALIKETIIDP